MAKINSENPVHILHHVDGVIKTFTNYFDLLYFIKTKSGYASNYKYYSDCDRFINKIGRHFSLRINFSGCISWWRRDEAYNDYIVRDRKGRVFSRQQLKDDMENVPVHITCAAEYETWAGYVKQGCKFRFDPVPHVGGGNHAGGSYIRNMSTTQERRNWEKAIYDDDECEYRIHFRNKRSHHNLPNSWEDKPHCRQKNWKQFRDKQYKASRD